MSLSKPELPAGDNLVVGAIGIEILDYNPFHGPT
jgi:hypothetical protein